MRKLSHKAFDSAVMKPSRKVLDLMRRSVPFGHGEVMLESPRFGLNDLFDLVVAPLQFVYGEAE